MKTLLTLLFLAWAWPAQAALQIFACEPEWAALVRELAGERVRVFTATRASQDPHHVQARPSLTAAMRNADLVVCTGAELEAGWLPLLLRQAGSKPVFEAAAQVPLLEIPARLDRADGDVHAAGNPHIQTDPRHFLPIAAALSRRLAELEPERAQDYRARHADFAARWQAALQRWERQAAPLNGVAIVVQHKGFPYMERWLGLKQVAVLEPRPGVEPGAAHLAKVLEQVQRQPPRLILRAAYQEGRASEWLAQRTGLAVVALPYTVGGSEAAQDLFSLFDDTLTRLLAALK
ncbi:MAG: zinc ABC transporter substrate-binding protein [Betaproteobacteria bacterium]|nr:zinc ABC transporter substrate-binding protein [Betaproteobacteria bacterium]